MIADLADFVDFFFDGTRVFVEWCWLLAESRVVFESGGFDHWQRVVRLAHPQWGRVPHSAKVHECHWLEYDVVQGPIVG